MPKSKQINMTEGPFFKKLVLFAVPVTLTGLLQIVYNTADTAVVTLGVNIRKTAAPDAQSEANKAIAAIRAALEKVLG